MSIDDDLTNAIRREGERQLSGRYNTRTGLVTSYDPKTHSSKVMIKPGNLETGWLPDHTGHIGNGFGILAGLTPGDGKTTGDQVELTFTEGDLEQGRIIHRLFSDQDTPPPVESGEILIKHQSGGSIFFDKTGKITVTGGKGQTDQNQQNPPPTAISKPGAPGSGLDPNSQDAAGGQTIVFDTTGIITHTGIKGQTTVHAVDGSITHTGIKGHTVVLDKDGNINLNSKNQSDNTKGNLVATATNDITHTATSDITHTASGNISHTAGGTHTIQSAIHSIQALTNVSKLLKVTSVSRLTSTISAVSGGSSTLSTAKNLLDPPGTLSSYTFVMPTVDTDGNAISDGTDLSISFGRGVTSLTMTGTFNLPPPTSAVAGQVMNFIWSSVSSSWWSS